MKIYPLVIVVGFLAPFSACAQMLDPRLRDEDISATRVTVSVSRPSASLYKYTYTVSPPINNKGTIRSVLLDLACPQQADRTGLPAQEAGEGYGGDASFGFHSPVNLFAAFGSAAWYSVDANHQAAWLVARRPGQTATNFGVVSTMPPKPRRYMLVPLMDNSYPWDYESVDEDDPSLPWIEDFTVAGMVDGPSCPGDVTPPPPALFGGSLLPSEDEDINGLLTYSEPLVDRFHLPAGSNNFTIKLSYRSDVNPKSIKVEPAAGGLRSQLQPQAGGTNTLVVPLKPGKNKIIIEAMTVKPPEKPKRGPEGMMAPLKDRDVFEVYVPVTKEKTSNE